nr:hypothetical protein [Streptomyces sp. BA2]
MLRWQPEGARRGVVLDVSGGGLRQQPLLDVAFMVAAGLGQFRRCLRAGVGHRGEQALAQADVGEGRVQSRRQIADDRARELFDAQGIQRL